MKTGRTKEFLKVLFGLITIGLACSFSSSQLHSQNIFFQSDIRSLRCYDIRKNKMRNILRVDENQSLHEFKQATISQNVGVLILAFGDSVDYRINGPKRNLIILDSVGRILKHVESVIDFSWPPTGDSIALIRGRLPHEYDYKVYGEYITTINSGSPLIKIAQIDANKICWAAHNNKIYTSWGWKVEEIDLVTHKSRVTKFRDIYFSRTGRYYFHHNSEGEGFAVYKTKSNQDVTPPCVDKKSSTYNEWLTDDRLIVGDYFREKVIIDLKTNQAVKKVTGYILGIDYLTSTIILQKSKTLSKNFSKEDIEIISVR